MLLLVHPAVPPGRIVGLLLVPKRKPGPAQSNQGVGERRPGAARDALLAQRLKADVIRARVKVRAHDLGDLLSAAVRDHCVDEPV